MNDNEKLNAEILDDDILDEILNEKTTQPDTDDITVSRKDTGEAKKLSRELEKQKDEYNKLYDKYLRIAAEYDNFRKRSAKEKESMYSDAAADILSTLLPVFDNLERAAIFDEPEKVLKGVQMILNQLNGSLDKLGVTEIKALGESFNPELHNAVLHETDDSESENTVTEVMQKGYVKGDRVIRPAMVKVVN